MLPRERHNAFSLSALPLLPRAEHRWQGRMTRVGLSERSEFRPAPTQKPIDEASIMALGKAQREVRRAAIDRL